ncbi:MAG: chromosome segregation protein SMC, partial [Alphaproteobacteria bacterium]|nr:chromosome segregation protein SMC [Alphaproteobacteria bacterium]
WRWDGFTSAAEAPTPAAKRLAEKNRLVDLRLEADRAKLSAEDVRQRAEQVQSALAAAASAESDARNFLRTVQRQAQEIRDRAADAERRRSQISARVSALAEAQSRLTQSCEESRQKLTETQEAMDSLSAPQQLINRLERMRANTAQCRADAAEARASVQGLVRDQEQRQRRREAIISERGSWDERRARAHHQIEAIETRISEAQDERATLVDAPSLFLEKRRSLMSEVEQAEIARKQASDRRAEAETALTESDRVARLALDAMSSVREDRARMESRVEGLRIQRESVIKTIVTDLECAPEELATLAGLKPNEDLPEADKIERRLESLKQDRERVGAVNLRADDELVEVEKKRDELVQERDDLTEAIRKLRLAIQSLNREGRERLLAAFEVVNGHFKELFTTLFGGGAAELQLVESDDPLEAGLEILARPPGKKPSTMTLLSGGEQALTAMSLIFAVFLTNPSPICVLDEVDAPLDDSNVERFCDLLDEMRKKTDTRFVTITHNPITMARMDRLFGVTMAERGVSQLVSVELREAESFLEAV